jgi:mannobiose 2-epimerase
MVSAEDLESVLRQHVLDAWFPRCVDRAQGGYLCDFDRAWRAAGPQDKLLEFQARHLCAAADAARLYPAVEGFREAMQHGFRYLREVLWDREWGGWFHRLDRSGRRLENETKHAHGIAYAIDACVAVFETNGDPAALELAREGFRWLEQHSHDREHGGHFGFLQRNGSVIREPSQCPWPSELDTIGTPIGLKDLNVHSDLLETFIRLYRIWPDPVVAERLAESVDIISRRMLVASTGGLHYYVTPDWRPIPHLVRAGYQFQVAYRLTMEPELTGRKEELRQAALTVVDHALRHSRDPNGGFFYAAAGALPHVMEGYSVGVKHKTWWVQLEGLKTLFAMTRLAPEQPVYRQEFMALWEHLHTSFIDQRYGGFYACGLRRRHRAFGGQFAPQKLSRKGDGWKDARHDTRALLYCLETLRSEASGASFLPLEAS